MGFLQKLWVIKLTVVALSCGLYVAFACLDGLDWREHGVQTQAIVTGVAAPEPGALGTGRAVLTVRVRLPDGTLAERKAYVTQPVERYAPGTTLPVLLRADRPEEVMISDQSSAFDSASLLPVAVPGMICALLALVMARPGGTVRRDGVLYTLSARR